MPLNHGVSQLVNTGVICLYSVIKLMRKQFQIEDSPLFPLKAIPESINIAQLRTGEKITALIEWSACTHGMFAYGGNHNA